MTGTGMRRHQPGGCAPYNSIGRWPLDGNALPSDFKEFLKLLHNAEVEYLLIGGYAVAYHGYPRTTADMDVWVAVSATNATKLVDVFRRFGLRDGKLTPKTFQQPGKIIRMGVPPMRIEVLTEIAGVGFAECYAAREIVTMGGLKVNLISLRHLRANKQASGRHKDLDDLEHLPERRTKAAKSRHAPHRS